MESSELFSHAEQQGPVPNTKTSTQPTRGPVFSDQPTTEPRSDAPRSS